jgi:hypothetical protein
MSLPTRNNPYSFGEFLEWRNNVDYYADDPFIQKVVKTYCGDEWPKVDEAARELSPRVSYRWKKFAEAAARPEERPYLITHDGHNNRIDRIVRPGEVLTMEKEIFSEAIFSERTSPWVKLVKMYLIYQNGETCIACPMTCTEGAIAIMEQYADAPEVKRIYSTLRRALTVILPSEPSIYRRFRGALMFRPMCSKQLMRTAPGGCMEQNSSAPRPMPIMLW